MDIVIKYFVLITQFWILILFILLCILSFNSAIKYIPYINDNEYKYRWSSLGSLSFMRFLITAIAIGLVLFDQSEHLEYLQVRAAGAIRGFEDVTRLHAKLFYGVVILVVYRALYVIGEFDNGFYNLTSNLPLAASRNKAIKIFEWLLRATITSCLLVFVSMFWKTGSPVDGSLNDKQVYSLKESFGNPLIIGYEQRCGDNNRLREKAGLPQEDHERCIRAEIDSIPLVGLYSINEILKKHLGQFSILYFAYMLMFVWAIFMFVVYRKNSLASDMKATLLKSLGIQAVLPVFCFVNLFLMLSWGNIASDPKASFILYDDLLNRSGDPQYQRDRLFMISVFGIILAMIVLYNLTRRALTDLSDAKPHLHETIKRYWFSSPTSNISAEGKPQRKVTV